jgi:hypothetical protein
MIGDDERLLSPLRRAGRGTLSSPNFYVIDATGACFKAETRQPTSRCGRDCLPAGPVVRPGAVVWTGSVPISAALTRAPVDHRLSFQEDLNTPEIELFTCFVLEGGRFAFCPEYPAKYRMHSSSETSAGLKRERLVPYLEPIPVDAAATKPYERRFMEPLLVMGRLS